MHEIYTTIERSHRIDDEIRCYLLNREQYSRKIFQKTTDIIPSFRFKAKNYSN